MNTTKFYGDDFTGFLRQLVSNSKLEATEEGITRQVIDRGYDSLSDKQRYVFENGVIEYIYDDCERCGLEIPWSEMYAANENGGLCGWCAKMSEKRNE